MRVELELGVEIGQFLDQVREVCDGDTCHPGAKSNWGKENPLWGHCGVISELARQILGGEIVLGRVRLPDGTVVRHIWNQLPDGEELDLTWEQFPPGAEVVGRKRTKAKITDPGTLKRVRVLAERVGKD